MPGISLLLTVVQHLCRILGQILQTLHTSGISRSKSSTADDLDPNLPLRYAVKDLYVPDPTQEVCHRPCRLHGSQTSNAREIINIRDLPAVSAHKSLDHQVGIDNPYDLSEFSTFQTEAIAEVQ